jgi:hypothetical protein
MKWLSLTLIILVSLFVFDAVLGTLFNHETTYSFPYHSKDWSDLYQNDQYAQLKKNTAFSMPNLSSSDHIQIETNEFGMRMGAIQSEKPSDVVRISIMGDHIPFGWGMQDELTFIDQLRKKLQDGLSRKIEVLNFSAPGFTTNHLYHQYESLVKQFQSDILIIAAGSFDTYLSRFSEKELVELLENNGFLQTTSSGFDLWRKYSLGGCWLHSQARQKAYSLIQSTIKEKIDANQWNAKVSPADSVSLLQAIYDDHSSQQGKMVLVNTNLLNFRNGNIWADFCQQNEIPYLHLRQIFDHLGQQQEREFRFNANLHPEGFDYFTNSTSARYIFRTRLPDGFPMTSKVYIWGNHPKLGMTIEESIMMYNDKTHGDETRDDFIWTYELETAKPESVTYSYISEQTKNRWSKQTQSYDHMLENRQLYYQIQSSPNESSFTWYSPVWVYEDVPFRDFVFDDDMTQPNQKGHKMIANRLFAIIQPMIEARKSK